MPFHPPLPAWALLLLCLSCVGEAAAASANTSLNITVNVTVTSTVRIEWDAATRNGDGSAPATVTTAATWNAGSLAAGATAPDTVAGDPVFIVRNAGSSRVDLTAQVTAASGLAYTTAVPTLDNFRIAISNDGFAASDVVVPSGSAAAVTSDLATGATATFDLRLDLPTSLSAASTSASATVTLIATAG